MAPRSTDAKLTPAAQLTAYLERFDADTQKLVRSLRTALGKRLPTANELIYDYGTSVVVAYTPTSHGKDAILTITARADGVALYFLQWKQLPDPAKLLKGSGKQVRFLPVESARALATPAVEALISAAIARSAAPLPAAGGGEVVVRPTAAAKRAASKRAK